MALVDQKTWDQKVKAGWQQDVVADLAERLTPPSEFPCTFSQNAFRRQLLQISFIEEAGEAGFEKGASDLLAYIEECKKWDGRVDSAKPLLMVFSPDAAPADTLEAYQDIGWQALQYWHDNDPEPWPKDVSTNPESPFWSFCFGGMQLFVNMSCPAHHKRKSRNLGRHLTLVINPRERFDVVAGDTPEGDKVRAKIRKRSEQYDDAPHSPLLGSFHKGELEWVQYALPEDNAAEPGQCPFRQRS